MLLSRNDYSRPGTIMGAVLAVIMHYTQAPGWSAENLRDYFEGLKSGREGRSAGAHYGIDEDESILMIPHRETAYHCGSGSKYPIGYTEFAQNFFGVYPNSCTIGIEMCINLKSELSARTVDNARAIATIVCMKYSLDPLTQILRHHDVTGKFCPISWVQHPEELAAFRESVKKTMEEMAERGQPA